MTEETKLLLRYVDGDLSPSEAEEFRARLADNPELERELVEMQTVGSLVRAWANGAEARGNGLLEPTLTKIHEADQRRARHASLGLAVAALVLALTPWAEQVHSPLRSGLMARPLLARGAAIERLEAGDSQAQVFVVGSSATPVVWVDEDAIDDDADLEQQDPG